LDIHLEKNDGYGVDMTDEEEENPPTSLVWETDEDWFVMEDRDLAEHWCWWEIVE